MKIAAIQMNSGNNKSTNLKEAARLINTVMTDQSPDIIVLPEMFTYLGNETKNRTIAAECLNPNKKITGEAYCLMQAMAKLHQVVIHAGSLCELDGQHHYNTSVIFARDGSELGRYRKIHLFEINVNETTPFRENDFYQHGNQLTCYPVLSQQELYQVGASICFDLRFPHLFQQLTQLGCQIIMIPSAFFSVTGEDHWEVLCRARAIETQSYIIAAAQTGTVGDGINKREYWGHSMIIDPWGKIIADAGTEIGYICAEINLNHLNQIRKKMPLKTCQRQFYSKRNN